MGMYVDKEGNIRFGRIIGSAAVGIFALVLATSSWTTVPSGSTGVIVTLGKTQSYTYEEGFHFKAPFVTKVVKMSNQVQKTETNAAATSKDLQTVNSTIAINYHLSGDSSNKIYKQVGQSYAETLLDPAIQESVKNCMAQYSAEQLITQRSAVSADIYNELSEKMNEYGIFIDEFNIINFDFSTEFNNAIEAKQVAEQNKLKAETEKEQRVIEAEASAREKELAAEAEANATLAKANAEAEAIRVKADAEAEANSKISASLTPEVLDKQKLDKWNGDVPQTILGGNSSSVYVVD